VAQLPALGHVLSARRRARLLRAATGERLCSHLLPWGSTHVRLPSPAQFFMWEMGYMSTIDIMHDRAGYYICWGCLVWVPVR
jgi:hypothetical protein